VVSRAAKRRASGIGIAFTAALALLIVVLLMRLVGLTGSSLRIRPHQPRTTTPVQQARLDWTDSFGDGTPNFLRLTDPADQAAFRRWFTLIAEYQAIRPQSELPSEIIDCASLLRYSYREALRRHDEQWFMASGMPVTAPPGQIRAWHYPNTPLGLGLFRVQPGAFQPSDATSAAFAEFAGAETLVERNAFLVSRDVRTAQPGDLLFYRQFGQSSPWHSMIVTRSVTQAGPNAAVVYHTGPDHGRPGELRRVNLSELLDHPQPQWRPIPANPNFLGVYRWNILRGTP
jgi:hypothetical protein